MTIHQKKPISMFLFYVQEDERLLQKLETYLDVLKQQGLISSWRSQQIGPGTGWAEAIDTHLQTASIILLLVSAKFLASEHCCKIVMPRAMQRHDANEARVIPIIVRPCHWDEAPFARLQCLPRNGKPVTMWGNRDDAWNDVTADIRQAIGKLLSPVASAPHAALPVWNVPYPHNPFFIGREDVLKKLFETLKTGQPAALSQPQAVSGLGGIGKTRIALEYAYRYRHDYRDVLWARAGTREELTSSYLSLARELNLPQKEVLESPQVISAVKSWLQDNNNRDWLLILDNVTNLALVDEFLPWSFTGHVLLTTCLQATGRAARLDVGKLSIEEGALFLLRRSHLLYPGASLEQASWEKQQSARAISKELGGLPLALDQAGAYIEETKCPLVTYLRIFEHRRADLLAKRGGNSPDEHCLSVVATWSLAFEHLKKSDNSDATDLLRFCAFLAPEAIPIELFTRGASFLGPELSSIVDDPLRLNKAIAALLDFSLLNRDPENDVLSVHELVQAVLRDSMGDEMKQEWRKRVVQAIVASFPSIEDAKCEQWLPHALESIKRIIEKKMVFPEAKKLVLQTGAYLCRRARYEEAGKWYRLSLEVWEQHLGLEHPEIADFLSNLGSVYSQLGKYREAEPLYRRCLKIREQHLGMQHPDIADPLNNLAILCKVQGNYEEAERFYHWCLDLRKRKLGAEHPYVAQSLNNLGVFYAELGKYEEYERVKRLGLKPHKQKKTLYEEAEQLFRLSLAIREQTKHPDVAQSFNNLANLFTELGRYEEAEQFYQRCFELLKQHLGPEHPDIAYCLNGWGLLFMKLGKYDDAKRRFEESLHIWEQGLGCEHPQVAYALNNLAMLARAKGDYKEALCQYQRSLSIFNRCLGPKHLHTQTCAWSYARVLYISHR